MPKSRVRSKAVYTPPPRSAKAKVSPPWLAADHAGQPDHRPGLDRGLLRQPAEAGRSARSAPGTSSSASSSWSTGVGLSTKWH